MIITQMITLFLCLTDQSVLSCVDINIDEHCMVELGPQLEDFVLKLLVELLSQLIVRLYAAVLIRLKLFWTIPYSQKRQAANGTGIMYPKCSCSFLVEFLKQFHRPKKKKNTSNKQALDFNYTLENSDIENVYLTFCLLLCEQDFMLRSFTNLI